jgi:hypothetical protein
MERCTVSLADYTRAHRARVLFNHLYFSNLPESRLQKLVERRIYRRIVEHQHFNPRIVEGISNYANSKAMSDEEYLEYIQQRFDDPQDVWEHPFRYQISPTARRLLILLWSFGKHVELDELKAALKRMDSSQPPEEFVQRWRDTLRELDGNFLTTNQYPLHSDTKKSVTLVEFQNPSVRSFIETIVSGEPEWFDRLAEGIVSFEQVEHLASHGKDHSKYISSTFWLRLDEAGRLLESKPTSSLVNYAGRHGTDISREWGGLERITLADRTVTRLTIAGKIQDVSISHCELKQRLTSPGGWREMLSNVEFDDSVAYAAERLMKWVQDEDFLCVQEKKAVGEAFSSCLCLLLSSPDEWAVSASAILELAKTCALFNNGFSPEERTALRTGVLAATEMACDNIDDSDTLFCEADAVDEIGKLCGIDLTVSRGRLIDSAVDHQRPEHEYDSRPERGHYKTEVEGEHDIDALFYGLVDR